MNSLSWMIYLAGVASGLGAAFVVFAVLSAMASLILVMAHFIEDANCLRWLRVTLPCMLVLSVLSILTPDKETVYAIAASEFGEEALKSPEVSKARQALNAWLDKQIDPEKSK